jgi:hypothetical protein
MADRKPGRMSDDDLIVILRKEEAGSRSYQDGTLSPIRTESQAYYDREHVGIFAKEEGASGVVTSEFQDVVEGIMPGLMEVFTGGDQVVEFTPEEPGQEQWVEEASDYVSHCVMQKNNGFQVLYGFIKDAIMARLGAAQVDLEDEDYTKTTEAKGLTQDAIDLVVAEAEKRGAELEMELMPDGPAPGAEMPMPEGMDPASAIVQAPVQTFSGTITVTQRRQKVVVDSIAPEDALFTPTSRDIDKCSLVGYRKRTTASELVKLGLTLEEVEDLKSDQPVSPEEDVRTDSASAASPERSDDDDSERILWLVVAFVRADFDGSGISSMERVVYAHAGGQASNIIERQEWEEIAPLSFATPVLMPHAIVGRSLFDQTKELQEIGSVLTRGLLDNQYLVSRPRPIVSDQVMLDSLLDWVPGSPIRLKAQARPQDGHVQWLQVPDIGPSVLQALEYLHTVRENRTGTSRQNQGLDADSLNKTARGMNLLMSAAAQRQKLMARVLAQPIARIFKLVYLAIKRSAKGPQSYWSGGKFKTVDPTKWPAVMDVTVNVGMGTGNTQQEIEQLMLLGQAQEKLVLMQGGPSGPFVTPDNVANLTNKLSEKLGYRTPGLFFQPAEKVMQIASQPQEPKPDPEMAKVQGQLAAQKAKQEGELQLAAAKAQAEAQQRREQAAIDMQLARERADAEMQIARERAILDMQLAREKADLDAQLKVRELDQEAALGAMEIKAKAEAQGAAQQREQEVS